MESNIIATQEAEEIFNKFCTLINKDYGDYIIRDKKGFIKAISQFPIEFSIKEPEFDEHTAKLIGEASELAKKKVGKSQHQRRDYSFTKEGYHLICDKCGMPYWNKEAFPKFQLCDNCKDRNAYYNRDKLCERKK